MKKITLQKNVYDLEHSEHLTKAGILLGLAITTWITILLTPLPFSQISNITFAIIISSFLLCKCVKMLKKCWTIREKILKLQESLNS